MNFKIQCERPLMYFIANINSETVHVTIMNIGTVVRCVIQSIWKFEMEFVLHTIAEI